MSATITRGSTNSPDIYRDTNLTSVVVGVHATAAELTGWNIINPNTSDVYVKFYNGTSGDIVAGTTVPEKTLLVPASASVYFEHLKGSSQHYFPSGMSVMAVTGLADSNTTAPTTDVHAEIFYKPQRS